MQVLRPADRPGLKFRPGRSQSGSLALACRVFAGLAHMIRLYVFTILRNSPKSMRKRFQPLPLKIDIQFNHLIEKHIQKYNTDGESSSYRYKLNVSCYKVMPTNCSVQVAPQYQTNVICYFRHIQTHYSTNILRGFQHQQNPQQVIVIPIYIMCTPKSCWCCWKPCSTFFSPYMLNCTFILRKPGSKIARA